MKKWLKYFVFPILGIGATVAIATPYAVSCSGEYKYKEEGKVYQCYVVGFVDKNGAFVENGETQNEGKLVKAHYFDDKKQNISDIFDYLKEVKDKQSFFVNNNISSPSEEIKTFMTLYDESNDKEEKTIQDYVEIDGEKYDLKIFGWN